MGTINGSGVFLPQRSGFALITATSAQDGSKSAAAGVTVTSNTAFEHGSLVTSPLIFPSGLPSTVTVSVWLPDPALDPSTVKAWETDQFGRPLAFKGLLLQNSTTPANVYSLQIPVFDSSPAKHYYAVEFAAYRAAPLASRANLPGPSRATGLTYFTDVNSAISVPTVSVTSSTAFSKNIQDSISRISTAATSVQSLLPTQSKPVSQAALASWLSQMVSVAGNLQQLSNFGQANPSALHSWAGNQNSPLANNNDASSFWSHIPLLGSLMGPASQLMAEKNAFTGRSFNPNDPAVAGIMAWLAQNPDEESICSPDLQDDTSGCRDVIWEDFIETPAAGLTNAVRTTAATAAISEYTGLAETGAGDLLSNELDLTPLQSWAVEEELGKADDYFVDNLVAPDGRHMLVLGSLSNGKTTLLPNGSNDILLTNGVSETSLSSFAPLIAALNPAILRVASTPQTLAINGANFNANSSVTFNGSARTSTFVTPNQLTIFLAASDLAVPGEYAVTVSNSIAAGRLSTSSTFTITSTPSTTTITTGNSPVAIAINPVTNMIYVANQSSQNVTAINGANNSTTTIPLGFYPLAIAVNLATNTIYAAGGALAAINGATNVVTQIPLGPAANVGGGGLYAVAVNSRTNAVYTVDYYGDTTAIDGSSLTSTTLQGLGPGFVYPYIALNQTANKIYVPYVAPGGGKGSVTIIDGVTLAEQTIPVGLNPVAMAANPVTNQILTANWWSNDVTIVNGASGSTSTATGLGFNLEAIAVNPVTDLAYVGSEGGDYTPVGWAVLNPVTLASSFQSSGPIFSIAINTKTNKIYLVENPYYQSENAGAVYILDGNTGNSASAAVGLNPSAIAVNESTGYVYVANTGSNNVTAIGPQ
jgi:YVTN family beta-propeller protein